ncbi:MAG: HAD family hydrolase [Anaerolineales bacterium]|nr:HAD family hydrolase [Anaerolineales bacterium]
MPLNIEKIQALCFDVDGTLSDTDDQFVHKIAGWLHPVRFMLRNKDTQHAARRFVMWSETPGNIIFGVPDMLGLDDELLALRDWFTRNRPKKMKHFLLIEGIREMLSALYGRYPMAVVSARDEAGTMAFLEQFGLLPYFDTVVTALSAPHSKPYPDPVLLAAKDMGVAPEYCLMIGDTTVDIRAGKRAGAQTVGVKCGFGEEDELLRYGADLVLETTAELKDVLLNI